MALNKHNNYLYLSLILDNFKNPQSALHLYLRLLLRYKCIQNNLWRNDMILILVGFFSLIFVGGLFLVLSLIGIRQQVRFENGYDSELETDRLAMIGQNRK